VVKRGDVDPQALAEEIADLTDDEDSEEEE